MTTALLACATGCNGESAPGEEAAEAAADVSAMAGEAGGAPNVAVASAMFASISCASSMVTFACATARRASWMRLFLLFCFCLTSPLDGIADPVSPHRSERVAPNPIRTPRREGGWGEDEDEVKFVMSSM